MKIDKLKDFLVTTHDKNWDYNRNNFYKVFEFDKQIIAKLKIIVKYIKNVMFLKFVLEMVIQ